MIATWRYQASPGTTYWRCLVPSRELPGVLADTTFKSLILRPNAIGEPEPHLLGQEGQTAIWAFPGQTVEALLMSHQQETGIRVLVEVDDNYLVPYPHRMISSPWTLKIDKKAPSAHSHEQHRKICGWADGVICSTPWLANRYDLVSDNVFVCPNSVAPADWPEPRERNLDHFRIGYAGSASHMTDYRLVERALSWAADQPGVQVVKIGLSGIPWRFPHEELPWTDSLSGYFSNLVTAGLDLGVCPLKPNEWANGKSDVKALEYAMSGALPIVSREEPYAPWWDRVPTIETETEWRRAIKYAVRNRDEVRAKALEAREYVLAERTIESSIGSWREACLGTGSESLPEHRIVTA